MDIYTVQSGDTLWQIASRYGIPLEQIVIANDLSNPDQLVVGQSLVVPTTERVHIVNYGETLWEIAVRYGSTPLAIIMANNLNQTGSIFPGETLIIPARKHVVAQGETLWSIAQYYHTTVNAIATINHLADPNSIYPGAILIIPDLPKPSLDVNAYITNLSSKGVQIIQREGQHLTFLSPFSYHIQTGGSLSSLNESAVLAISKQQGIAPLMVITNFSGDSFSSDLAHGLLTQPGNQDKLITAILSVMDSKGYKGLNIDFEYVYPEDRENYNNFLQRVVDRLHPKGYIVSTALAPKLSNEQKGILYEAHDYEAHGRIVDFVVLMTYEWGWAGGPPLAIAPLDSVKKVLDYAVSVIPLDKIFMGIPNYGRDWTLPFVQGGPFAKTVTEKEAVALAAKYGVSIEYDPTSQSPHFRYVDEAGKTHEVWYEDAHSIKAKLDTVKAYGFRGISYWVLGIPFPQNWLVLENEFNIRKLRS